MRRALQLYLTLVTLTGVAFLFGRGRPEANAHPDIRGGGDWGFGGSDIGRPERS